MFVYLQWNFSHTPHKSQEKLLHYWTEENIHIFCEVHYTLHITHYTSTWTTTLTHHTKVCSYKFVSKGEINWLSNTNWHLLVKSPRLRTLLILKTSNLFNGNLKLECSFHSVYNQMFYLQPAVPCLGWPVVLRLLLSFLCQCWKLILKLFWANNICRSFVPTLPHKLLDKI